MHPLRQLSSGVILNIQKGHFRALPGELLDDLFADTAGAAGDDDDSFAKAGIGGVFGLGIGGHLRP